MKELSPWMIEMRYNKEIAFERSRRLWDSIISLKRQGIELRFEGLSI
jgi:hypothetical protein